MRDFLHMNTIKPKAYDGSMDTSVAKASSLLGSKLAPKTAYGIFTEDGLDGTEYSERSARKEAKDLREMGMTVTIIAAKGKLADTALDALHELVRDGKALSAKRLEATGAAIGVVLTKTKG